MAALRAKGRIRRKLGNIQDEKEYIIYSLEVMIEKATESANVFLQEESAHLLSKYHDVNQDLENCLEKLTFIQAAIDDVSSVEEGDEYFQSVLKKHSRDSSYNSTKQNMEKITSHHEFPQQRNCEQNEQETFSGSPVNEGAEFFFVEPIDTKITELVNISSEMLNSEAISETDISAHSSPHILSNSNNPDNVAHNDSCLQHSLFQKEVRSHLHQTEEVTTLTSMSYESQESFYHSLSSYSGGCDTNKTSCASLNDVQSLDGGDDTNVENETKIPFDLADHSVSSVNDRVSSTIINVAAMTLCNDNFPKEQKIHHVPLENEYKFISGKHEETPSDIVAISKRKLKTSEYTNLKTEKSGVPDGTNEIYYFSNECDMHHSENALNIIPEAVIVTENIIYGTVCEVVSPSDFWLKLYSSTEEQDLLDSIKPNFRFKSKSLVLKKNMCCLAPLDQNKGYCRAQIVDVAFSCSDSLSSQHDEVEIFYIDFGFTKKINVSKLCPLPVSLSTIPVQAIHCTLSEVFPIDKDWSQAAILKFKELTEWYQVEAYVYSKNSNGMYSVSLTVRISIEDENLEYNVGQMLCLEKFASNIAFEDRVICSTKDNDDISVNKLPNLETALNEICLNDNLTNKNSNLIFEENESIIHHCSENFQNIYANKLHDKKMCLLNYEGSPENIQSQYNSENCINKQTEDNQNVNLEQSYFTNKECCISKRQYSNTLKVTSLENQVNLTDSKVSQSSEDRAKKNKVQTLSIDLNCSMENSKTNNSIHSLSVEDIETTLKTHDICEANELENNSFKCLSESTENLIEDGLDWDATIPPLDITLIDNKYLFVMMSALYSPGEFYVNVAVENSVELDELQERMNSFYGTLSTDINPQEVNLHENQFCCCRFSDDNCWYRAKIINMCKAENKELQKTELKNKILVQYIDYGNKEFVTFENLKPLTARFAKYPAYAVCCALAGVKPNSHNCLSKVENCQQVNLNAEIEWGLKAIENFKMLIKFEKCLTIQVLNLQDVKSVPLQVLLWDTHHSVDVLINAVLIEQGVVTPISDEIFKDICRPFQENQKLSECSEQLDDWNPMEADFWSAENSYAVDLNDPEVAVTGYKSTDEKYICKFYDQYGRCHRGEYCPYRHMPCGKEGTTRDKQDTYAWGPTLQLPNVSSYVLVQVSAVFDPGHFYIIFPYGCVPIQKIETPGLKDIYEELCQVDEQLEILVEAMSNYYSLAHFEETTTVAPALGNIVAAKCETDGQWYRSRIIEVEDVASPVEVFFVDFGNCEWISRKNIREIKQEFLHLPFQAVECFMAHIEPKNFHKGNTWSRESRKMFKELVEGKILLAHIVQKIDSILYLELETLFEDFNCVINLSLVSNGFAQCIQLHGSSKNSTSSSEMLYIPG